MISPRKYIHNLALVTRFSHIDGVVVECGVWKGGMCAGIAEILGPDRDYYLFDSFEGLPPAQKNDGPAAIKWQKNKLSPKYYNNCSVGEEYALNAMKMSGVDRVNVTKGWFHDTLPDFDRSTRIAILRLDADWYESTTLILEHLYPLVVKGGLIIIDDYYTWEGCSRAVHDYFSRNNLTARISQFENDICFVCKKN